MASAQHALAPPRPGSTPPLEAIRARGERDSVGSWPLVDRVAYALCWTWGSACA